MKLLVLFCLNSSSSLLSDSEVSARWVGVGRSSCSVRSGQTCLRVHGGHQEGPQRVCGGTQRDRKDHGVPGLHTGPPQTGRDHRGEDQQWVQQLQGPRVRSRVCLWLLTLLLPPHQWSVCRPCSPSSGRLAAWARSTVTPHHASPWSSLWTLTTLDRRQLDTYRYIKHTHTHIYQSQTWFHTEIIMSSCVSVLQTMMLDKWKVCQKTPGESNFLVFSQMLAGLSTEMR